MPEQTEGTWSADKPPNATTGQQAIAAAHEAIDRGQPHAAVKVLERALNALPHDGEIAALLTQCRQRAAHVLELVQKQIPALAEEKKFVELRRVIAGLEAEKIHIRGLPEYRASVEKMFAAAEPLVQNARRLLERGEYEQALADCWAALEVVSDHEEATALEAAARQKLEAASAQLDAVKVAAADEQWFEAERLLGPDDVKASSNRELAELAVRVRAQTEGVVNYWRLLAFVLLGGAAWFASGGLASIGDAGLQKILARPLIGWGDLGIAFGWAIQLLFAAFVLPFCAAIVAGPRGMRSAAWLIGAALMGGFLMIGAAIGIERLPTATDLPVTRLLPPAIYAVVAAQMAAALAARMLRRPQGLNLIAPAIVALAAVLLTGYISGMPGNAWPAVLSGEVRAALLPHVAGAMFFWCLLVATGLCINQVGLLLLLPLAVVLSCGLELGFMATSGHALWPLFRGLLPALAVLPLQAAAWHWGRAAGVLLLGCFTAALTAWLIGFATVPQAGVLLSVWCAAGAMIVGSVRPRHPPRLRWPIRHHDEILELPAS